MRTKDDLFKLIKAMPKSEKRYFSLDAQKGGKRSSRYLDLFKYLNDQEEWDEVRLKKKFPKNLSSDKAYLYDAILRSMRDYRSQKSKAAQIKEKIQDSRYLFERGLYKQCDTRLIEASEIAKELGDELMILEVARERLLTIKTNKDKNFTSYVEQLLIDKEAALTNVKQFFKYSDAYYEMIVKVTKNFQSPVEEREQITLPDFFEEEANDEKSPQAERRYLQSQALYYQLKGDKEKVLYYFKETAEWWDRHPALKNEEFFRYIIDTSNLLFAYQKNENYEMIAEIIKKLKAEEPQHHHDFMILKRNILFYQLNLYIGQNQLKKAKTFFEQTDQEILYELFKNNVAFKVNIAILYFKLGNLSKSQHWAEEVLAEKSGIRHDIENYTRLLLLVILLEKEEIEAFDNSYRSTKRYFKDKNLNDDRIELLIINQLKKLSQADWGEVKQQKNAFAALIRELKTQTQYDYFNKDFLEVWLNRQNSSNLVLK